MTITIKLVAPPTYVVTSITFNKKEGLAKLSLVALIKLKKSRINDFKWEFNHEENQYVLI